MIEIFTNETFLTLLAINTIAAIGMNIVYSSGQLNLGQAGFLAVGAYVAAVADVELGWPLPPALLLGAAAAGIVAFPVAWGANRVRGIYLIMGTLAVGEIVRVTIGNIERVGGVQGYRGMSPVGLTESLAVLAVILLLATALMASRLGLRMRSIFDDEDAAAAAGVATRRAKILSVVLSAAVVGVAGGLLAKWFLFVAPRNFGIAVSFQIALYTLIGGVHSLLGAVVGAVSITYLIEVLRGVNNISYIPDFLGFLSNWRLVVFGVLVMVAMAYLPEGLISRATALRLTRPFREYRDRLRSARAAAPPRPTAAPSAVSGTVLQLERISHRFGGIVAVDDVTLDVSSAEILALIGANGAGKTTLIDVTSGRYRSQQGTIKLEGVDVTRLRPEKRAHAGIARTFQNVRVFDHLTVEETVRLGRLAAGEDRAFPTDEVLKLIGLRGQREQLPASLTLADRRLLEIGRALAARPRVLLLDEPSVGMNEAEREELSQLVQAIRHRGTAVVLVDHNLDLALGVADRVAVLDFGKLVAVSDPSEVFQSARVREAYLGSTEVVPGMEATT